SRRRRWPANTALPERAPAQPRCGRRSCRSRTGLLSLARFGQRCPERLEDRLEHVTAVGAVEEAYVQDEPRVLGQHLEEPPRDVGSEPPDAGLRQVDIGDEERLVARLE